MVAPPPPSAAAAPAPPPACPFTNTWQRYCNRYTSTGSLGSIGLIGDSVLLGSADGASNPGLPSMLNSAGWGPINLVATLGMKTRWTSDNNVSAQYWIKRWHDNGFHPDVIAVNLGANHLGSPLSPYCTPSDPSKCTTQINYVLDHVAAYHPNARIWWAKVNHQFGGAYTTGMLGWNAALDLAAASRPNLVLWDWPTALATANPAILMDSQRIHPSSGTQYVKRSTLMRDHIGMTMPWATYTGPRTPLPAAVGDAVGYDSLEPSVVFDSADTDTPVVPAGTVTEIDLSASAPDGAVVADLVLSTTDSAAGGWLTAWSCEGT
ncbi:MAG TPA: hypothetical protein DCR14_21180, partial [Acidimicrobiaceae bacterium]|nr:hypothetical protein [Acidimicrobiaceae bacterium]